MVDRIWDEVGIHLEEHIRTKQTAGLQLASQSFARLLGRLKNPRWPEMRSALKQSDVHALEIQHGDEVENFVVGKQRKCEIGAGQLQFHDLRFRGMNAVFPPVSHSAAVR